MFSLGFKSTDEAFHIYNHNLAVLIAAKGLGSFAPAVEAAVAPPSLRRKHPPPSRSSHRHTECFEHSYFPALFAAQFFTDPISSLRC